MALPTGLEQFRRVVGPLPFRQFYINSFAIAIIAVIVTVFINLLCGYTFAKYKFPGPDISSSC